MKPPGRLISAGAGLTVLIVVTAIWVTGGTARRAPHTVDHGDPAQPLEQAPRYVSEVTVRRLPGPAHRPAITTWARGSWCWFGDPRSVEVGGRRGVTFAGWIDWRGRITVGEYSARSGKLRTHVIGRQAVDDHGSPSILVEPDRRLTVFWSGHSAPTMQYRTSGRPLEIGAWGPVHRIRSSLPGPKGFTYPNPELLRGEHDTLYLFWRGGDWSADYATRTAAGRWSAARRLIAVPHERPYVKIDSNGTDSLALAFTNGHPRGVVTSIYYTALRAGSLWTAGGRRIARVGAGPIAPQQADLVYDAWKTGVRAWVWDVAYDNGRPVIVYATFPSARRHLYWYATWTGRRWVSHEIAVGGPTISPHTIERDYSAGLVLDHHNPSVVYLSRKVGGSFEIERWTTADRGSSWRYTTIARTPGADDVRPVVPRGAGGGPIELMWLRGHYRGYRRYRTSIAFLNSAAGAPTLHLR
jgi:hypothetical protein